MKMVKHIANNYLPPGQISPLAGKLSAAVIFLVGIGFMMPFRAQEISEGGMKFSSRSVSIFINGNESSGGTNSRGSAAVVGGSINTGSAASDITSELNPVQINNDGSQNISVAGENSQFSQVLPLRDWILQGKQEKRTVQIERGTLDQNLKILLLENPKLVEKISKENPAEPSKPYSKLQFTENYTNLEALLSSNKTTGSHILSSGTSTQAVKQKVTLDPGKEMNAWNNDSSNMVKPSYSGYSMNDANQSENVLRVAPSGAVGTTSNNIRFSVVGFAKNPNPDQGKTIAISAFATNNRTVGTISVPDSIDGKKPTLPDIAIRFGTSVEQLMQVNNLPSAEMDIAGLKLTVPADLLTVDYHIVEAPTQGQVADTPRSLANRFGVSIDWLKAQNGWTDSDQALSPGQKVQIPGLTKSRTTPLPPAKPLAAELETADYGAYAATKVTYSCVGSLASYCARFLKPMQK